MTDAPVRPATEAPDHKPSTLARCIAAPSNKENVKALFAEFDSGKGVQKAELQNLIQRIYAASFADMEEGEIETCSETLASALLKIVDTNKDGILQLNEFMAAVHLLSSGEEDDKV